jgi:hypothetical protein
MRDSDPPLCSAHAGRTVGAGAPLGNQNRRTHGFYGRILQPDEVADLEIVAEDTTIDDEIAIARIALRRVFKMLLTGATLGDDPQPLSPSDQVRLLGLVFRGVGSISRVLRIRQQLPGFEENDPIHESLVAAYEELTQKWGIEL